MQEKPTNELDELLAGMKPEEVTKYLKENRQFLADSEKGFCYYMRNVIESKNIMYKDVYSFAGMTESYGSKLISMEKHTTNRDVIIRLCVAAHFTLDEMNRALKLYGMNPLYAKDKRDAVLIVAISNRKYDFYEIDTLLAAQGFEPLSK